MSGVQLRDRQALALVSGNACAFPGCDRPLISPDSPAHAPVIIGEIAHIVGESRQGPRGNTDATDEERNRSSNLVYLCPEHHKVVDDHPRIYSVGVLRQMKADHETRMSRTRTVSAVPEAAITERVYSTLLPFTHLPATIFSARCTIKSSDPAKVAPLLKYDRLAKGELAAFQLHDERIYVFQNLAKGLGAYEPVTKVGTVEEVPLAKLAATPDGRRQVVAMLNAAVRKLLQPRRLYFDKFHKRFWFKCIEDGVTRSESYRTATGRSSSIQVAWQPIKKATNEPRDYWWHRAARLSVQSGGDDQWFLSIRPERHLTTDGSAPLPAKRVGRRVTSLKARMYNDKYQDEVWFWKEFLAAGGTDIILSFGDQSAIIAPALVSFEVTWPGVVGDKRRQVDETGDRDLFQWAAFRSAVEDDEEDFPDE